MNAIESCYRKMAGYLDLNYQWEDYGRGYAGRDPCNKYYYKNINTLKAVIFVLDRGFCELHVMRGDELIHVRDFDTLTKAKEFYRNF